MKEEWFTQRTLFLSSLLDTLIALMNTRRYAKGLKYFFDFIDR
jgi:hypothetical protein